MKKSNSGFTLVELAVAILIFAIGITGIAKLQMESLKGGIYSTNYNDAVNLAKDLVEQQADSIVDETYESATGVSYTYTVTNQLVTVAGAIKARQVAVTVGWSNGLLPQSYTLTALGSPES